MAACRILSSLGLLMLGTALVAQESRVRSDEYYLASVMRPGLEVLQAWQFEHDTLPEAEMDPDIALDLLEAEHRGDTRAVNLLSYQSYPAGERDQGLCGCCWVFGTTLAAEISMGVHGKKDALSVQYCVSNFGPRFACHGGSPTVWVKWYNEKKKLVPLSNTNAAYQEAKTSPKATQSCVPGSSISTTPHHTFQNARITSIKTKGAGQSKAIANIKNILNQKKVVLYYYLLPNDGWKTFTQFWKKQPESAKWNPDQYIGKDAEGGHLVCIVGYDDRDQTWLVENSWGVTAGRPTGLFRIPQKIDYDGLIGFMTANFFEALEMSW